MLGKSLLFSLPTAAVFAQEGAPHGVGVPTPGGGLTQTLIMIGVALVFFYFILWRPEQKRRKTAEKMRSSLKKGDRVTAMGIIGKVEKIQDQTVVLKMVDGSKIEFLKGAITDVQASASEETKEEVAQS